MKQKNKTLNVLPLSRKDLTLLERIVIADELVEFQMKLVIKKHQGNPRNVDVATAQEVKSLLRNSDLRKKKILSGEG